MDTAGVRDALKQMSGHLSDLDQTLQPLLTTALSDTIKKLPLLDRAKLYVTICSIIETLLYCRILPTPEVQADFFLQHTCSLTAFRPENMQSSKNCCASSSTLRRSKLLKPVQRLSGKISHSTSKPLGAWSNMLWLATRNSIWS
jgi:hypothetical protein